MERRDATAVSFPQQTSIYERRLTKGGKKINRTSDSIYRAYQLEQQILPTDVSVAHTAVQNKKKNKIVYIFLFLFYFFKTGSLTLQIHIVESE